MNGLRFYRNLPYRRTDSRSLIQSLSVWLVCGMVSLLVSSVNAQQSQQQPATSHVQPLGEPPTVLSQSPIEQKSQSTQPVSLPSDSTNDTTKSLSPQPTSLPSDSTTIWLLVVSIFLVCCILTIIIFDKLKKPRLSSNKAPNDQTQHETKNIDAMKVMLSNIQTNLEKLVSRVDNLQSVFNELNRAYKTSIEKEKKSNEPVPTRQDPLDEFCSLYNAGAIVSANATERRTFLERYKQIYIDVPNATQQIENKSVDPIFQTSSSGYYWAVKLDLNGKLRFAVVPQFDLTIQDSNYREGAIGKVFQCQSYVAGRQYRSIQVKKPAFFSRGSNETWKIESKGELIIDE